MGCIQSKKKFKPNAHVEGQTENAMKLFHDLGLQSYDIDLLYTAFWDIDADNSGLIRPAELFNYFEVEETPLELGLFSIFDIDGSGVINFMEFVSAMWNMLTLTPNQLGGLAYLIQDPSLQSYITFTQVRELLEMMHKKKIERDPSLLTLFQKFKANFEKRITLERFCDWTIENPSITHPLSMLQHHLRVNIIGEKFWDKQMRARADNLVQSQLNYIKVLQNAVMEEQENFQTMLHTEEQDRRRASRILKGIKGDAAEHVKRHESRLLSMFHLKRKTVHRNKKNRVAVDVTDNTANHQTKSQLNKKIFNDVPLGGSLGNDSGTSKKVSKPESESNKHGSAMHTINENEDDHGTSHRRHIHDDDEMIDELNAPKSKLEELSKLIKSEKELNTRKPRRRFSRDILTRPDANNGKQKPERYKRNVKLKK